MRTWCGTDICATRTEHSRLSTIRMPRSFLFPKQISPPLLVASIRVERSRATTLIPTARVTHLSCSETQPLLDDQHKKKGRSKTGPYTNRIETAVATTCLRSSSQGNAPDRQ